MTIVSRCPACQALVNPKWRACFACKAPIADVHPASSTSADPTPDWLRRWRELAELTSGIAYDDPLCPPIVEALAKGNAAFKTGDLKLFNEALERIIQITSLVPGKSIYWRGFDRKRYGPATITEVAYDEGRLWICSQWAGQLRWINEILIEFDAMHTRPVTWRGSVKA